MAISGQFISNNFYLQQSTETRLHELLAEDNYLGAIQLLLEFQQTAETYKHFTCISELSKKLLDTMETAEEQLDMALSKVQKYQLQPIK